MAETITLVSAFDRKRTLGDARLTEGRREKGRQQKNCVDRRYLFFACSKPLLGVGVHGYAVFRDRPAAASAWRALVLFVRRRPHAAAPSKGSSISCLMR